MRASPGDRRVAEPVGYENLGQADGIANHDQGDSHGHAHGHGHHAYGHGHGHADTDTDTHDGDAHVNTDADDTNPGADPGNRRYGG